MASERCPGLMPTKRMRTPGLMRSRSTDDQSEAVIYTRRMNWLFKEEPSNYSYDAFAKDKKTVWSGVRNPVAQRNLRSIKKCDSVFYYHTGDEKSVVGIAKAAGDAYPDPQDKTGNAHVVDIVPVRKLKRPVTLAEIKADPFF